QAVLRTAQDIFALDKAFFLIEGHPSREKGFVLAPTVAPPMNCIWFCYNIVSRGRESS
ncbi:MAG: hypothetical protein QOH35_2891, partial [Acidobacteriaceae bacterium]|nr:hypothetical protein [Acidobacteriaceae bacterium]